MTTIVLRRNHHPYVSLRSTVAVAVVVFAAIGCLPSSAAEPEPSTTEFPVSTVSGNGLWDDLVTKCGDGPKNTMDCVRSRLYNYVNNTFESDFNITDGLKFKRNSNDYESMCPSGNATAGSFREARADTVDEEENEVDDGWGEVKEELYNKGAKYLVTHDFEATVPSFLGGGPGAKVRLSPKRILPDGGIILRMDVLPAESDGRSPRFMHKMIKQLFKKKLLSSAMAMMLIVKLIKIKVFFLLPLLIGAGAAKKILLKVLLFLFPPLAHLFKLCSYYHHHASKYYHFHHHKVKHHHHHLKIPVPVPVPVKPHGYHPSPYPSPYSSNDYIPAGPPLDHPPGPYDSAEILNGGGDYYNRNGPDMSNDELASWGLGEYGDGGGSGQSYDAPQYTHSSSPAQYEPPPVKSAYLSQSPPSPPPYLSQGPPQSSSYGGHGPPSSFPSYGPPPHADKYIKRLDDNNVAAPANKPTHQVTHDPLFTPVVQKLDEIFRELSVADEPCREKLVCKMYGNPAKFSPHSNLVSAQLSSEISASSSGRTGVSADAARLWRYVQAAKEGQNGEDCRVLYPSCNLLGL